MRSWLLFVHILQCVCLWAGTGLLSVRSLPSFVAHTQPSRLTRRSLSCTAITKPRDIPDEQQRAAILSAAPAVLLVAGAGTGKTRVLSSRVAYLLSQGYSSAREILILSFTKEGALQIKQKAEGLLSTVRGYELNSRDLWADTFHGFCSEVVRKHWHLLSDREQFTIADADEQLNIIRRILQKAGIRGNEYHIARQIQYWKEHGQGPSAIPRASLITYAENISYKIYPIYQQKLKQSNSVDFSDLQTLTLQAFRAHPQVLQHYRGRFRHVIVDEFQDISPAQYDVLRHIVLGFSDGPSTFRMSPGREPYAAGVKDTSTQGLGLGLGLEDEILKEKKVNLFCAGDDDQSIYGWRGARIELMRRFRFDFLDADVIRLGVSYRNSEAVLSAAHTLIQHNADRIPKHTLPSPLFVDSLPATGSLWQTSPHTDTVPHILSKQLTGIKIDTTRANITLHNFSLGQGTYVEINSLANPTQELQFLAKYLLTKLSKNGVSDIALLTRTTRELKRVQAVLKSYGIPFNSHAPSQSQPPAQADKHTDTHPVAYLLRLLYDAHDDEAFERSLDNAVVGTVVSSSETHTYILRTLKKIAQDQSISLEEALHRNAFKGTSNAHIHIQTALSSYLQKLDYWRSVIGQQFRKGETGFRVLKKVIYDAFEDRWSRDFAKAADEVAQHVSAYDTLEAYYKHQGKGAGAEKFEIGNDSYVSTMTMHAAKGLEFAEVLLPFWNQGVLPRSGTPEERRLAYVSLTRAKERVIVTYSKHDDNLDALSPSCFIEEMGGIEEHPTPNPNPSPNPNLGGHNPSFTRDLMKIEASNNNDRQKTVKKLLETVPSLKKGSSLFNSNPDSGKKPNRSKTLKEKKRLQKQTQQPAGAPEAFTRASVAELLEDSTLSKAEVKAKLLQFLHSLGVKRCSIPIDEHLKKPLSQCTHTQLAKHLLSLLDT